jgi:hypothetical protein
MLLVTDDTRTGRPDAVTAMTTPIVKEQPPRLTPVDRDTFCEQPAQPVAPPQPRRRPQDA